MQFLDAPAVLNEGRSQVVEQFRIGGAIAHDAEVAAGADETGAEVSLPDAVHDHAGGEGIFRVGQPVGERGAAAGAGEAGGRDDLRVCGIEDGEEAGLHLFLGGAPGATGEDESFRRVGAVVDHGLGERGMRFECVEFFELSGHQVELLLLFGLQFLRERGVLIGDLGKALEGEQRLVGGAPFGRGIDGFARAFGEAVHVLIGVGFADGRDQGVHGSAEVFGLRFPLGLLFVDGFEFGAGEGNEIVFGADVREEGLEAVVILVEDRIELVVVALGAAEGHAQERGTDGVGDVHEEFLAAVLHAGLVGFVGVVAEEAGRDVGVDVVGVDLVAGNLFADEAVVGFVVVERLNHIVAIAPDVGANFVGLEAVGVGVAGYVEPFAAPAFTVVGRGEQAIDDFREGVGGVIGQEGLGFFGGGREADKIERGAAEERDFVGGAVGPEVLLFQLREDERIDGIALGSGDGLEGPVALLGIGVAGFRRGGGAGGGGGVPDGAGFDPVLKDGDLLLVEASAERHLRRELRGEMAIQAAFGGVARHEGRAVFATFHQSVAAGEIQVAHLCGRTVALDALGGQQRGGFLFIRGLGGRLEAAERKSANRESENPVHDRVRDVE